MLAIPRGRTRTYGEIARELGGDPRDVGAALRRQPDPGPDPVPPRDRRRRRARAAIRARAAARPRSSCSSSKAGSPRATCRCSARRRANPRSPALYIRAMPGPAEKDPRVRPGGDECGMLVLLGALFTQLRLRRAARRRSACRSRRRASSCTLQNGRGVRPANRSARMPRWVCQPPETPTSVPRSPTRRCVTTSRTSSPFGTSSNVTSVSEPCAHVMLSSRGGSHRVNLPVTVAPFSYCLVPAPGSSPSIGDSSAWRNWQTRAVPAGA